MPAAVDAGDLACPVETSGQPEGMRVAAQERPASLAPASCSHRPSAATTPRAPDGCHKAVAMGANAHWIGLQGPTLGSCAQNSVASRDRVQLGALDREGRRVVFQSMSDVSGEGRHDRHRVDESATVDRARGMLRPVRPALGGAHAGAPAAPGWRGHERLGAGPYERVPERTGQRNGTDPDCPTPVGEHERCRRIATKSAEANGVSGA